MRSLLLAGTTLGALAGSAAGQQRLTATELSVGAAAGFARHTFVGAELGLAYRPPSGGQSRIAFAAAGGAAAGHPAGRAQLTLQFLVTPTSRRGVGLYAGIGAALTVRRSAPGAGLVALLLGLESAPGRASRNWYVETGLGGGIRVAAGWRVRWFPRWWTGR